MPGEHSKELTAPGTEVRLFIGTKLGAEVAEVIHQRAKEVSDAPRWRMAPIDQWHVTALFIGGTPLSELPRIQSAVERIANTIPPIPLQDGRLMTMPLSKPSMLWMRFSPAPALTELHLLLSRAIGVAPSPFEPYWPHVTLARTRENVPSLEPGPVIVQRLVLEDLTLFRSDPGPNGSVHIPLIDVPFTG